MSRIIDLSLPIYHMAPTMGPDPKCAVIAYHTIDSIKYNLSQLIISSHQGTHLDAPYHFFNNGRTLDKLDLSKCVGPAEVFDLSYAALKYNILPKDLKPYESRIKPGSRILLRTNWYKKFSKKEYFSEGPRITPQLAAWLAEKKIALLGIETPGPHPTEWEKVHKSLLKEEVVIVEGLANLNKIKEDTIFLIALPLKIKGRDGSPIRAIAIENFHETCVNR